MPSHNQFSINLKQQKNRAKKRLKAAKQGDPQALAQINKHQIQANKLTPDNIKLADVQFSLARELGLPSWSKLKAHAEELAFHRKAIETNEPAPDADIPTLHIRCGHDIQERLNIAGFNGKFLAIIDPLCMGPIPETETHFIDIRARYVEKTLFPVMNEKGSAKDIAKAEQNNVDTLLNDKLERIVFWVEHDSYDQLMLLRGLNLLEHSPDKLIEIIELNDFPGTGRFMGLGQLPTEAIRSCWKTRKPISTRLRAQAKTAWSAIRSKTPEMLINLIKQKPLDCLPNLQSVIKRHLQELPHYKTGLSMTQQLGLSVLQEQNKAMSFGDWFRTYQQREPLPFLGDTMFYALMQPLSLSENPLFTIDDVTESFHKQRFRITAEGIACLAGEAMFSPDYWVGGIQNSQQEYWCWDHQNLSTICHIKQ